MASFLVALLVLSLFHIFANGDHVAPGIRRGLSCKVYKQCCKANAYYQCKRHGTSKMKPYFLSKQKVCDGITQCPLKDDENNCPKFCKGYPPSVGIARMVTTPKDTSPVNTAVKFECPEGYLLAKGTTDCSICQEDGTWSTSPTCVRVCRQEDAVIDNGSVEAGTAPFVEGSPILFKCNVGFITAALCNGTNSLVCQEDGSWKGNAGCKPQLPLTCSGEDPCTNAVARGGSQWRLCYGADDYGCHPTKGRLEVLRDEEWRGVCDDNWNDDYNFHRNLLVACRSLGFQYGVEWIKISANDIIEDIDFWLDEVNCSGFESNLNECQQNQWGDNNCNPTKYIGISCGNPCSEASTFPPPRSVR